MKRRLPEIAHDVFQMISQVEGSIGTEAGQQLGSVTGFLKLEPDVGYVLRVPDVPGSLQVALFHHFWSSTKPGRRLPHVSINGTCVSGPMAGARVTATRVTLDDLDGSMRAAVFTVGEVILQRDAAVVCSYSEIYFANCVDPGLARGTSAPSNSCVLARPPYPSQDLSIPGFAREGVLHTLVRGASEHIKQELRKHPYQPTAVLQCKVRRATSVYAKKLRAISALCSLAFGARVTTLMLVERDHDGRIFRIHCRTPSIGPFESAFQLVPSGTSVTPNGLEHFLQQTFPQWEAAVAAYSVDVAIDYLLASIEIPVSEFRFLLTCIGFERVATAMATQRNLPRIGHRKKSFEWLIQEAFREVGLRQEVTFINWRNCVIHTGDFPQPHRDGFRYYKHTLAKLQLFLLKALGYKGPYYDLRTGWGLKRLR